MKSGAFTGAMSTRSARVELSHNGTLFLDEVGSLDLAVQSKLLQVLQDGTFIRVGGHEPRSIATRLVSASNSTFGTRSRTVPFVWTSSSALTRSLSTFRLYANGSQTSRS